MRRASRAPDANRRGSFAPEPLEKDRQAPAVTVTAKKVLALSRPERPLLIGTLILGAITEFLNLAPPLIVARAYDAIAENFMSRGDQTVMETLRTGTILPIFAMVFGCFLSSFVISVVVGAIQGLCGERVVARLRARLYRHMLSQEMGWFDETKSGDLVSRLGSDTQLVRQATTQSLNDFITALLRVGTGITLMFVVTWELTIIVFSAVTFFICCIAIPLMTRTQRLTAKYQEALGKGANVSTEALGAMRTVRSFAAEAVEYSRYIRSVGTGTGWIPSWRTDTTTYRYGVERAMLQSLMMSCAMLILMGAVQGALWLGFILITYGRLSFGTLTAFQAYTMQVVMGIAQLAGSLFTLAQAKGGTKRIFEYLERVPKITPSGGIVPTKDLTGQVSFVDVAFAFPTRPDIPVLKRFCLEIPANSTAALVGQSGCGKSTAMSLLLRFYEAAEGCVLVDGHDVTKLEPTWLRARMAFVQQEPILFGISVEENVKYGLTARRQAEAKIHEAEGKNSNSTNLGPSKPLPHKPGSCLEDKDVDEKADRVLVERACAAANAHSFIQQLGEGYDTMVGERGVRLSGGQKQRIAIARAILAEPRMLLLDEATSALDAESERLVQEALDRISQGRTVMVVAHRLSTVRDADQIALVGDGVVQDSGRHNELLNRCEAYKTLVSRQVAQAQDAAAYSQPLEA